MPLFKILPTNLSYASVVIEASDASAIVGFVDRIGCDEADVLKDEVYLFSVRYNALRPPGVDFS